MKVINNDLVFRVRFEYSCNGKTGPKALKNIRHKRVATRCVIETKIGEEWHKTAIGMALRNPDDVFRKTIGRRIALINALKDIQNREVRKAIWDEYVEHFKVEHQ